VIGPGVYCLARIQDDRGGRQPQATLKPLAGLAGWLLAVAILPGFSALKLHTLAADQAQATEGIAVQPDGRPQIGQGVGVVGRGLLGQLDLGEADYRMGPLTLCPGQAELAGEGDELALVVVLAAPGGVFDPAGMGPQRGRPRAAWSARSRG
jgi:hypothetical protein